MKQEDIDYQNVDIIKEQLTEAVLNLVKLRPEMANDISFGIWVSTALMEMLVSAIKTFGFDKEMVIKLMEMYLNGTGKIEILN